VHLVVEVAGPFIPHGMCKYQQLVDGLQRFGKTERVRSILKRTGDGCVGDVAAWRPQLMSFAPHGRTGVGHIIHDWECVHVEKPKVDQRSRRRFFISVEAIPDEETIPRLLPSVTMEIQDQTNLAGVIPKKNLADRIMNARQIHGPVTPLETTGAS
jgi:hypothetical protein